MMSGSRKTWAWRGSALAVALVAGIGAIASAAEDEVANNVTLELKIAGLGPKGCEVEIKAGHPGCSFDGMPRRFSVKGGASDAVQKTAPIKLVARSTSADRDCMFAITIKEPGKAPRTVRRGLSLEPAKAGEPMPSRHLTCYLSTPSLAAKDSPAPRRR